MRIQRFQVVGLFGCREPIHINFTDNIHVLSGKNGAGKTTIMKLIWYFISGNLEKALIEVPFKEATIETDIYTLKVIVNEDQDTPFETIFSYNNKNFSVHDKFHRTLILSGFCLLKIAKISLNSSFFPKPIKR